MDWFSVWEPAPYPVPDLDLETLEPPLDGGLLVVWLALAVVALVAALMWSRRRVVRHSFWCATAGRDVDVRLRGGSVRSCSAFEDPTAITCARRCRDRSFRMQRPPLLPVLVGPHDTRRLA